MPEQTAADGLCHMVLSYRNPTDYRAALTGFIAQGLARREPVLVAVPHALTVLPDLTDHPGELLMVAEMTDFGRNPGRIIPALHAFADQCQGQRARIVTESAWPGRSHAELREAARYEALVNQALTGIRASVLCPYDAAGLPPPVLATAARCHPWQFEPPEVVPGRGYVPAAGLPAASLVPLPSPPLSAESVEYQTDLRTVRAMVTAACERAGLSAMQATDLTLAVSEVASNTLRHTSGGGTVQAWRSGDELLCEVRDTGQISDPLAGVRRPAAEQPGGHGLWLVHQVCDLVEMRSGASGTVVRLHMRIPPR